MARDPSPEVTGGVREAYKLLILFKRIGSGKGLKAFLLLKRVMGMKYEQQQRKHDVTWLSDGG